MGPMPPTLMGVPEAADSPEATVLEVSEETAEVASEVAVEPQAARLTAMEAASIALMTFLFIVIPS